MSLLLYDSGVGGLAYLGSLQRRLHHNVGVCYVADSAYFPFGDKPEALLATHIESVVKEQVARWRPGLVLLACNTASVLALDRLRDGLEIPVVGTVPAIKPAAASSTLQRIAVLATERTLSADYLDHLIGLHAQKCEVCRIAAGPLVDFIEKGLFQANERELREQLKGIVEQVAIKRVDRVVLGCTHFLHIAQPLRSMLPKGVTLVDSLEGVVLQVLRLLAQGRASRTRERTERVLWTTGGEERWRYWAERYQLRLHRASG